MPIDHLKIIDTQVTEMSFMDSFQVSFKFFKTIKVFFADVAPIFQELFKGRLYVLVFEKKSFITKDAKRIQFETVKLLQCFDKQNLGTNTKFE